MIKWKGSIKEASDEAQSRSHYVVMDFYNPQ